MKAKLGEGDGGKVQQKFTKSSTVICEEEKI